MTLEYIRLELVKGAPVTIDELDRRFRTPSMLVKSGFREDPRLEEGTEKFGPRISAYENADRDLAFGTQHRYGIVSDTRSGIIHLISLFYAFVRCASAKPAERKAQLEEARLVARKLQALAKAADAMVAKAQTDGKVLEAIKDEAWGDPHERLHHEKVVMEPLFKAYRETK